MLPIFRMKQMVSTHLNFIMLIFYGPKFWNLQRNLQLYCINMVPLQLHVHISDRIQEEV